MSDPVEIMRRHICEHEVCQMCPGLIQSGYAALRQDGWRIVKTFPGKFGARNLVEIREEWLPKQPDHGEVDDHLFGKAHDRD